MFRSLFRIVTISEVSLKFDNKKSRMISDFNGEFETGFNKQFKTFQSCGKFP